MIFHHDKQEVCHQIECFFVQSLRHLFILFGFFRMALSHSSLGSPLLCLSLVVSLSTISTTSIPLSILEHFFSKIATIQDVTLDKHSSLLYCVKTLYVKIDSKFLPILSNLKPFLSKNCNYLEYPIGKTLQLILLCKNVLFIKIQSLKFC